MGITLVAYWGVGLPLGYGLGIVQNGGPQALWIGLIAGLLIAAVLLLMRFLLLTQRMIVLSRCQVDSQNESCPRLAPQSQG